MKDFSLQIHSIYLATEGEGIFIGSPQVFIRLQGCNIGCLNCDSKETWSFEKGSFLNFPEVLKKIKKESQEKVKRLSITGGDPLHPRHANALKNFVAMAKKEYWINIEASGSRVDDSLFDQINFISFDFKTPSTGVNTSYANILKLAKQYPGKFQIKSVVSDEKDFFSSYETLKRLRKEDVDQTFSWCLTPCFESRESFPAERIKKIIDLNYQFGGPFRVIVQQHKVLFGSEFANI